MSSSIMEMVSKADLLDYSQNLNVTRNYLGDTLFPDIKTQHLKAEFYRMSDPLMLPTMAQVHALDTETHIGQRPTMEKVKLEKMFIKEQINQSERLQLWLEEGVTDAQGNPAVPTDNGPLNRVVLTKDITGITYPIPTTVQFEVEIQPDEFTGEINEVALIDKAGNTAAKMRLLTDKGIDAESGAIFRWQVEF